MIKDEDNSSALLLNIPQLSILFSLNESAPHPKRCKAMREYDSVVSLSRFLEQKSLACLVMGNKIITFTHDQLDNYQDCTFFNKKEILKVFKKFRNLSPELIPLEMTTPESSKIRMPKEKIIKLPELSENPFKERICESFSKDGFGNLNFEEFLDCLSVFSEHAPRDLKIFYAFKIYDYDADDFISETDIRHVLKNLTKNELTMDEQQKITEKIIEEGDIDNDGKLSFLEFETLMKRAPDFISTFHIRI